MTKAPFYLSRGEVSRVTLSFVSQAPRQSGNLIPDLRNGLKVRKARTNAATADIRRLFVIRSVAENAPGAVLVKRSHALSDRKVPVNLKDVCQRSRGDERKVETDGKPMTPGTR